MKLARTASTIRAMNLERSTVVGAIVTGPWVGVKRHVEETPHGCAGEFESIGEILRRLRLLAEREMTEEFNPALSLRLDDLIRQEETWDEEGRP